MIDSERPREINGSMNLYERIAAFKARRDRSGPLPSGIAPATSSEDFKDKSKENEKPWSRCWNHRLSQESGQRTKSSLKASASLSDPSSSISLGTARPASKYSPWESLALRVQDPSSLSTMGSTLSLQSVKGEAAYDLDTAMNYGHAAGSPQLLRYVTEHIELIHDPPYRDWTTCLTSGTTSGLDILLRMLCNRSEWILTESFTYSGTIEAAKPLGIKLMGLKMDEIGLIPEDLDEMLTAWNPAKGRKPCVLYTIPSGQNPTGATQSNARRHAVYAIAERHDLCIIEDDPYFFLQLDIDSADINNLSGIEFNVSKYVSSLPKSYLSLDTSGRVLRLDSTSKTIAPGVRCGWITGSEQLISKFLAHIEFSVVSPSGPSQLLLYKLLDEAWGHKGFLRWLLHLSTQYRSARDTLLSVCEAHLPSGMCHWQVPTCGMFLWIQVDLSKHPQNVCCCKSRNVSSNVQQLLATEERVYNRAKANGVQVSKGSWFAVNKGCLDVLAFRLTFAACSEEKLEVAVMRFAHALRLELAVEHLF